MEVLKEIENNEIINESQIEDESQTAKILEEELDKSQTIGIIKEYFTPNPSPQELKEMAVIFGQTEGEIKREFGSYKAKKLYLKMDYLLSNNCLNKKELDAKIKLALRYGFKSVTVMPNMVGFVKSSTVNTELELRALISYPFGEDVFKSKVYAVKKALSLGANSVIVCVSIGAIKNGEFKTVAKEFKKIVKLAGKRKVYALLDTDSLNLEEIEKVSKEIVQVAKIHSIILSTKLFKGKISLQTLKSLVDVVDGRCFVDGGGDVITPEETVALINAGANVVSTENCVEIAENLNRRISAET
ncbi:MAG: hypothetical protein IKV61_00270 [Clostridia bacterium]|nr:hypothetical protein [Clostridia bacterium]